jgi:hypothetical protein
VRPGQSRPGRSHFEAKEATMNTTTINVIDTLLKLDDPAAFATLEMREHDFIEPADPHDRESVSMAVWIGPDAAVMVPVDDLAGLDLLIYRSGNYALRGRRLPSDFGIAVAVFTPNYRHPAGGSDAYQAWRLVTDTLAG